MSKKIFRVLAIVTLLALCVTAFVACNKYDWNSIGGGDSTAQAVSNGGYMVQQGKYIYFVNGYVGESTDGNAWGAANKGAIVRAEMDENGKVKNDTCKVVVPKNVYTSTSGSGIAIYGEWIYYATYNYDKDKNGNESTTDLDFMRTKIDASVTQLIGTIKSRSAKYKFTPSRVLYYESNTISYLDFSKMPTNKEVRGKNVEKGTLAENVASVSWAYSPTFQAGGIEDYIFYTQTLTGDNSYKNYNELYAIKYDGSSKTLLATEGTYLANGQTAFDNPQKVFKFSLLDIYYEDSDVVTLYYTKSFYKDSADTNCGLYCNKFNGSFDVAQEKQLNSISSTTIFPLGYTRGALAYNANSVYCWYNGTNAADPVQVNESSSARVWYVDGDYAYFTASDAEELFKINYTQKSNVQSAVVACMKADWYPLEIENNQLYFFTDEDNNYLHVVDITQYDPNNEDTHGSMIGIYNAGDEPKETEEE